jgi:hypothetical protein
MPFRNQRFTNLKKKNDQIKGKERTTTAIPDE